jgi:hypothetical protein
MKNCCRLIDTSRMYYCYADGKWSDCTYYLRCSDKVTRCKHKQASSPYCDCYEARHKASDCVDTYYRVGGYLREIIQMCKGDSDERVINYFRKRIMSEMKAALKIDGEV